MKFIYVDESGDSTQSDIFVMAGLLVDAYRLRSCRNGCVRRYPERSAVTPGGSSSERKRSRPIRAFSATPHDGQRRCRTLLKIPAEIQLRAAYPRRCSSNATGLPGRNSARILGIRASSAGVARKHPCRDPGLRPSCVSPTPQLKRE
jgi:hypothetical protein